MSEKFEKINSEFSKKEKFIDAIKKVINLKLKNYPFIDIEKFTACFECKKHITKDSVNYKLTPEGRPYCSIDCFVKNVHPLSCVCELCDERETIKLYNQILSEFKQIHGATGNSYAMAEAKKTHFFKK